mmetsp:Transcript_32451/g.49650  ORF Transcript_32451/g.49650 Transcript_32451/m.49650 type:complete len:116 (-) Transcript_32451:56-403(-)
MAKKKGIPKSDYSSLSTTTNVKKTNYERFALCCYTSAFILKDGAAPVHAPTIQTAPSEEHSEPVAQIAAATTAVASVAVEANKIVTQVDNIQKMNLAAEQNRVSSITKNEPILPA